jgi:hypothetical protein
MIPEGEMWLKGLALVDTLCHGEVAEWLNAAVSKTVTSVIPASGVRIPPSPRFLACQPVSTQRPAASACQHFSFSSGVDSRHRKRKSVGDNAQPAGRFVYLS